MSTEKVVRLQIISDVHTEFGVTIEAFRELLTHTDITILAGDIVNSPDCLKPFLEVCREFSTYVIFVCGNHEYYMGFTDEEYESVCKSVENVYFLQRSRINIEGLWFAGTTLWTDINYLASTMMNDTFDYYEIKEMHRRDKEWLSENVKEGDIIITHHLPSMQLIHPKYKDSPVNTGFATDLDDLILQLKPRLYICGHTHCPFDQVVCGVRVIINPVGYPEENPTFNKKVIELSFQ